MSLAKWAMLARAAEIGSLTKAAEEAGVSQSGASHMIGALENEVGFALLRRSRSGVSPTDEGERLLPYIRAMLADEERLTQHVALIKGLTVGTVRVGAFTSVAVNWLPGIIKRFSSLYPGIDLKLLNGDYYDLETWMAEGALDVAFLTLPVRGDCKVVKLKRDRILAVLPLGHPLAKLSAVPVDAIAREPFISLLEASDHDARRALQGSGASLNVRFTTKDDYSIMAMVENGLGVSIMPELVLKCRPGRLVALPLDPPACRDIALAMTPAAAPAALCFAQCAADWVAEMG